MTECAHLNALDNRRGEQIDACVDLVGHEVLRLLNESRDLTRLLVQHHTILGGVLNRGDL